MGRTRSNTDSEALSSLEAGELSEPGASCVPRVSTTTPCPWGGTALVTTGEDCRPVWARNHLPGDTLRPTEVSRLSRAPGLASGWTGPLTAPSSFMLEGRTGPGTEELVDAGLGAARHKCHWAEPHEPFLPFLTEARRTGSLPLPRGCHRPPGAGAGWEAEQELSAALAASPRGERAATRRSRVCIPSGAPSPCGRDAEASRGKAPSCRTLARAPGASQATCTRTPSARRELRQAAPGLQRKRLAT